MPWFEKSGDKEPVKIRYQVWGDSGPWVTCINGYVRPHSDFRMFGKKAVEAGFRVLALDNRGSGETEYLEPFSFDDLCLDVRDLWDHIQIEKSHLVGISMGGFIGQFLAAHFPERIDRLALISTAKNRDYVTKDEEPPWSDDVDKVIAKLLPYFDDNFAKNSRLLINSMAKQIAKNVKEGHFQQGAYSQRRALEQHSFHEESLTIRKKSVVIHGMADHIIPESAAEDLAESIPDVKLIVYENAGHLLLAETPARLYADILQFIS